MNRARLQMTWKGSLALLGLLIVIQPLSGSAFFRGKEPARSVIPVDWGRKPLQGVLFHHSPPVFFPAGVKTDRVLVKLRPGVSIQRLRRSAEAYRLEGTDEIPQLHMLVWTVPPGRSVLETVGLLRMNPDVEYAEPDYRTSLHILPGDRYLGYQYGLVNLGQEIGGPGSPRGVPGADTRAVRGWEETTGSPDVVIAVLDTGVDFSHPDLQENILPWGRDFVNGDLDPSDDNGHGTAVCGIIAADTDNGEGVAGVSWHCRILPVKGIDAQGGGYTSWMIQAILWTADLDVDIINLSVGAEVPSRALEEALDYAARKDILLVSSAGNHHREVAYPAAYPRCMAVAATDYTDSRASFSNFGPEVDVAAPGKRIYVCLPTWKVPAGSPPYGFMSGTSLSCAFVSGLAGLIKSVKPWLSAEQLRKIICYATDDVNRSQYRGRDVYLGYGRINLEKALVPIEVGR